jgi:iron complex transport system ATP-binding protein
MTSLSRTFKTGARQGASRMVIGVSTASLEPVVDLRGVSFVRDGRTIVAPLDWQVAADERWLVVGANGSGKTSLIRICGMYEHPSSGVVRVLGEQLGRTDVRELRRRIGFLSAALAAEIRPGLPCIDVVMTAKHAALEPWWHRYDSDDRARAVQSLDRMGVARFADQPMSALSSGEQQRVLLARTLMNDPGLILLDEPTARLDLGGREQLVAALGELTTNRASPPLVLVTHHLDEVPRGMTHALLLRDGHAVMMGPIDEALTSTTLSDCFGMPLTLERRADGRMAAWATVTPGGR